MIHFDTNKFYSALPTSFQGSSTLTQIARISFLAASLFIAKELSAHVKGKSERGTKMLQTAVYLVGGILAIGAAIHYLKFSIVETISSFALFHLARAIKELINEEDEDIESISTSTSSSSKSSSKETTESEEASITIKKKKTRKKVDNSKALRLKETYNDEASLYKGLLENHTGIWLGMPEKKSSIVVSRMEYFKELGVKKIYIQCASDDACNDLSNTIKNADAKPIKSKFLSKLVAKAKELGLELEPIEYEKGTIPTQDEKYVILAPVPSMFFVKEIQKQGVQPLAHRLKIPSVYTHKDFRITKTEIETNHDRGSVQYEVIGDDQPKTKLLYSAWLKKQQGFVMEFEAKEDLPAFASELGLLGKLGVKTVYLECSTAEDCNDCKELMKSAQKEPKKYKGISALLLAAKKSGIKIETLDYSTGTLPESKSKYVIIGSAHPKPDVEEPAYRLSNDVMKFSARVEEIPEPKEPKKTAFKTKVLGPPPGPLQLNVSAIVTRTKHYKTNPE